MHPRGNGTSTHIFAVRRKIRALDKIIGHSSTGLSRLLRIADGIVGGKIGRLSWVKPTLLARGQQRQGRATMITTLGLSPRVLRQYRPLRVPLGQFHPPAISRPFQDTRLHTQWLTSPQLKTPVVGADRTRTEPRQVNGLVSQQVQIPAPMPGRSQRLRVAPSIAFESIVQVVASRLSDFGKTIGKSQSLSEHARSTRTGSAPAIASFVYNDALAGSFNHITLPVSRSSEATTPPSLSPNTAVSRLKTVQSDRSGIRGNNEKEAKNRKGDLYLESSVLGRWLLEHLNQEISRPRAGTSAVDSRITPW
jgi:hypothetical protein